MTVTDLQVRDAPTWLAQQMAPAQVNILRRYICKPGSNKPPASDDDLMFFVTYCQANNLDPFQKQAYLLTTNQGPQVCLGIDALRGRAAASGDYAGQDRPHFVEGDDGLECHMTVYRIVQGQRCPFPAVAWMKESRGTTPNWSQRPRGMLEKCAEAKALRKAFPRECGAFYTPDELEERDVTPRRTAAVADINARLKAAEPTVDTEYSGEPPPLPSDPGGDDLHGNEPAQAAGPLPFDERVQCMVAAFDQLGGITMADLLAKVRSKPGREKVAAATLEEQDLDTLRAWYRELMAKDNRE